MRFIVDECTGPHVARWLESEGHDVFSVFEHARGMKDDEIITKAYSEKRLLVTNDKDFGEKVFRDAQVHRGVILLRLSDERSRNKIDVLNRLLQNYSRSLENKFVIATESRVRFAEI